MAKRKVKRNDEDFQKVADEYAKRSVENIRDMVEALEHAEECEEEGCKVGSETRRVKVRCNTCNGAGKLVSDHEQLKAGDGCPDCKGKGKRYIKQEIHEEPEAWHDADRARQAIEADALSIEVRSDWYNPGSMDATPAEYNILLGTGGPASRIIGELDEHCQPESAHFEYQDWFKPWTEARLSSSDEAVLLKYAQAFYFGN